MEMTQWRFMDTYDAEEFLRTSGPFNWKMTGWQTAGKTLFQYLTERCF